MKKKSILFALAAVCLLVVLSAQQERKITLNEAIAMARVQSVDAAVALNELKTAYWVTYWAVLDHVQLVSLLFESVVLVARFRQ